MRILLAIDGSKFSEAAVRFVIERARSQPAEVRVLHIVEPPSLLVAREMGGYDRNLEVVWQAEAKQAEALVAKAANELRLAGISAVTSVEEGDPKAKIIEAASKWKADVIVVGSHGHHGLLEFLLGGVSEAVARHAGCSVTIVRTPPE